MPDSASFAGPAPPPGIDITKPNVARVYDYWLDGKDNFAADRALGDRLLAIDPGMRDLVRGNRGFLCAAVARAAREGGISQFLDLGAGLPVSPAVHDAAWAVIPDARVAYVDNDPVAVLHTQAILGGSQGLASVSADLADPAAVLGDPATASVLDLERPMGIILGCVAHFIEPSRMQSLTATYLTRAQPGSWLIISLGRAEDTRPQQMLQPAYTAAQTYRYSLPEFESLFTGTEILPPGLREAKAWVAGTSGPLPAAGLFMHCGVGVKW